MKKIQACSCLPGQEELGLFELESNCCPSLIGAKAQEALAFVAKAQKCLEDIGSQTSIFRPVINQLEAIISASKEEWDRSLFQRF